MSMLMFTISKKILLLPKTHKRLFCTELPFGIKKGRHENTTNPYIGLHIDLYDDMPSNVQTFGCGQLSVYFKCDSITYSVIVFISTVDLQPHQGTVKVNLQSL